MLGGCRIFKTVFNSQQTWRNFATQLHEKSELINLVKKFSKEVLKPVASQLDQTCTYPREQISQLAKLGVMGLRAPEEFGGIGSQGVDMLTASMIVEELSRGCASTGVIVSIHNILFVDLLATHGNQQQKELYLKPNTSGTPGAFALSEAEAGSDVANISTIATKDGENFILNGCKSWVTSGNEAKVAIIFATVDKNKEKDGITAFLVPLDKKGVHLAEPDNKLGIRATSTCDINLCDVVIPADNVIGNIGDGFKIAMHQLNKARIGIASQALGIAQASLDLAVEYAICRRAFKKRLIDMQAVQIRLARMAAQIEASRLLVRKTAKLCDNDENIIKFSAIAKLLASEAATFSSHQCIQIMGGMGYTTATAAERHYRDARVTEIYGGVSDIQMSIIANQLLKEV